METKTKFIENLKNIMDTEENITLDTELSEIPEWDSVSMVAFFSYCGLKSEDTEMLMQQIENAQTVRDLYNIVDKNACNS